MRRPRRDRHGIAAVDAFQLHSLIINCDRLHLGGNFSKASGLVPHQRVWIWPMPRFFFDVRDGKILTDDEGTVFPDLDAARQEALRAAADMLKEVREVWSGEPWTMIVRDELGMTVAKLTFTAR